MSPRFAKTQCESQRLFVVHKDRRGLPNCSRNSLTRIARNGAWRDGELNGADVQLRRGESRLFSVYHCLFCNYRSNAVISRNCFRNFYAGPCPLSCVSVACFLLFARHASGQAIEGFQLTATNFSEAAPRGFGDRHNSWAQAMVWWNGNLYVGTSRDSICTSLFGVYQYAVLPTFRPTSCQDFLSLSTARSGPVLCSGWCRPSSSS